MRDLVFQINEDSAIYPLPIFAKTIEDCIDEGKVKEVLIVNTVGYPNPNFNILVDIVQSGHCLLYRNQDLIYDFELLGSAIVYLQAIGWKRNITFVPLYPLTDEECKFN